MKFYRVRVIKRWPDYIEDHLWPYLNEALTQFESLTKSKLSNQKIVLEEITLNQGSRLFAVTDKKSSEIS